MKITLRDERDAAVEKRFKDLYENGTELPDGTKIRMRYEDCLTQLGKEFFLATSTTEAILRGNYKELRQKPKKNKINLPDQLEFKFTDN